MTEKELKKLNRYQLLELLIEQTERANQLQELLEQTQKKLADQELTLSSLGSIAEASLQISGVWEAAQKAADLYLHEAKKRAQEIEEQARGKASALLSDTTPQAQQTKGEDNV